MFSVDPITPYRHRVAKERLSRNEIVSKIQEVVTTVFMQADQPQMKVISVAIEERETEPPPRSFQWASEIGWFSLFYCGTSVSISTGNLDWRLIFAPSLALIGFMLLTAILSGIRSLKCRCSHYENAPWYTKMWCFCTCCYGENKPELGKLYTVFISAIDFWSDIIFTYNLWREFGSEYDLFIGSVVVLGISFLLNPVLFVNFRIQFFSCVSQIILAFKHLQEFREEAESLEPKSNECLVKWIESHRRKLILLSICIGESGAISLVNSEIWFWFLSGFFRMGLSLNDQMKIRKFNFWLRVICEVCFASFFETCYMYYFAECSSTCDTKCLYFTIF